jgi:hypothetical protein
MTPAAIHEAGHAVAFRDHHCPIKSVTLGPGPNAGLLRGLISARDDTPTLAAIRCLAGPAAEEYHLGYYSYEHCTTDITNAKTLAEDNKLNMADLWSATRKLIHANRKPLLIVAQALQQHGTLTGPQIGHLIPRLADYKYNAPPTAMWASPRWE